MKVFFLGSVKTDSSSINGNQCIDDGDPEFRPPRKKRKYVRHVPPPTMIKTRGARLPKFTFEKRTHRKIPVSIGERHSTNLKFSYAWLYVCPSYFDWTKSHTR